MIFFVIKLEDISEENGYAIVIFPCSILFAKTHET